MIKLGKSLYLLLSNFNLLLTISVDRDLWFW
jgi:hypothetical protein